VRVSGDNYLQDKEQLKDFLKHNKIFQHTSEIKTAVGGMAVDLRRNLPYLCQILKDVQRRWNWLSAEEREEHILRVTLAYKEKKRVSKERRDARKKHDKMVKKAYKEFKASLYKK